VERVSIAAIGCGPMGESLVSALATLKQVQLVGAADLELERAQQVAAQHEGMQAFAQPGQMLEALRPEAVVIASPQFAHREHAQLAAAVGAHIFCEKPLATTVADCDAMIAATRAAGVQLMVGQVLRYLPTWRTAIELVRSGELGQPMGVVVTRIGGGFSAWARPWRLSHEQSGGILMEINSHEIDFMRCLCGEVDTVFCLADSFLQPHMQTPDNLYVSLRFKEGAAGVLHSSMASYIGESSGKIQCTNGTIFYRNGHDGSVFEVAREAKKCERLELEAGEDGVRRELREFVEAISGGTPVSIPGEEGRGNVEVAEAAYLSARTGAVVKLPLV